MRASHLCAFDIGSFKLPHESPLCGIEALAVVSAIVSRVVLSSAHIKPVHSGGVELELQPWQSLSCSVHA